MDTKKKSLKKNIALNIIKQLLSFVFPLITFPYVSQHLGSDAYGIYSYSLSIVSYLTFIAAMGITTYAVREGAKCRKDADKIQRLSSELFTINLFFTILAYIIMFLVVAFVGKITPYKSYIYVLSITLLFNTLGTEWLIEVFEDYEYLTFRYIVLHIISILMLFVFVHDESDLLIYCFITVVSSIGIGILNMIYRSKYTRVKLIFHCNFRSHIKPMFIFFVCSIATVIYVNSDITIMGMLLTKREVGIYSFSVKIYNMIKMTIATIISTSVARMTFYYNQEEKKYEDYLGTIYSFLSLIILPIVTTIIVCRKDIIYVLGKDEYISGDYVLGILSVAIIFAIFGSFYYSMVLILRGHEKVVLFGTAIGALVNIIFNILFMSKVGIALAAITTVAAEFINYLVAHIVSNKLYNIGKKLDKKPFIYSLVISMVIVIASVLIGKIVDGTTLYKCLIRIGSIFLMAFSVYMALILKSKNQSVIRIKETLMNTVKKRG